MKTTNKQKNTFARRNAQVLTPEQLKQVSGGASDNWPSGPYVPVEQRPAEVKK